jgi:hypothetical protein
MRTSTDASSGFTSTSPKSSRSSDPAVGMARASDAPASAVHSPGPEQPVSS